MSLTKFQTMPRQWPREEERKNWKGRFKLWIKTSAVWETSLEILMLCLNENILILIIKKSFYLVSLIKVKFIDYLLLILWFPMQSLFPAHPRRSALVRRDRTLFLTLCRIYSGTQPSVTLECEGRLLKDPLASELQ